MRSSRTNGTTTYEYIYNGGSLSYMSVGTNKLYFTYDASGTPMAVTYNGTNYYYATNLQGDVTAILNTDGTAVVQYTYDAWGNPLTTTGSMASTLGLHNPLRYRGYVYDTETRIYYLQSRYYDPGLGRFINADAFAATGQGLLGNNMFAYCANSPCSNIDTNGYALKSILDSDSDMVAAIVSTSLINVLVNKIKKTILDDTDWENSDKNHILRGTNKKHIEGWKRFGIDPEDPNNWSKVVLILTSIVNNNEPFKMGNAKGGGTVTYFAEVFTEIGVKVVVKIWTSADGLIQKLSDAIPYILDGN